MSFQILHVKDVRPGRARLQCPVCDAFNVRPWIEYGCAHCGANTSTEPPVVWFSHGADGLHAYAPDAAGNDKAACGAVTFDAAIHFGAVQNPTRRLCCARCWARVEKTP